MIVTSIDYEFRLYIVDEMREINVLINTDDILYYINDYLVSNEFQDFILQ